MSDGFVLGFRSIEAELMQYRMPVDVGPSLKTWPKCAPQCEQTTSVRMP